MCARKVGNAFQTKQGNRTSCRDQEGRRVSDEVVPGTSVFSSSETGMSGNFWGEPPGKPFFLLEGCKHLSPNRGLGKGRKISHSLIP